ncbi:MAG: cyclohydrolase [Alphaproteobacteria bacterium]|nr:cyclohydrolase [Alphaproteobacteria bacterium]
MTGDEWSVTDSDLTGLAGLFGTPDHIAVERGLAEFRSGRPVIITGSNERLLAMPVDGMSDALLASFRRLCRPATPHLVVTARRAQALGLAAAGPLGLVVEGTDSAAAILAVVADARVERAFDVVPAGKVAGAAIELAKLAQRLPALLVADADAAASPVCDPPLMCVAADAVAQFRQAAIASLNVAAEAIIPLKGALPARFVIFRDAIGGSSVAVIVGTPNLSQPVPLRLHSACLTGDVFGSRRCDCGDQLRLALGQIEEQGGGIILYLEQEGRGLGLANKMRTYQLQDEGLDTLDANAALGFDDDERDYGVAARMLEVLGCTRVRVLTNNPAKLAGLTQAGIEVTGRIPLHGSVNADNRRYLTAKATRAGHKLDHLLAARAEPAETSSEPVGGDRTS